MDNYDLLKSETPENNQHENLSQNNQHHEHIHNETNNLHEHNENGDNHNNNIIFNKIMKIKLQIKI